MEKKLQKIYPTCSLLNLVNNLADGIDEIKCKHGHNQKNMKLTEININIATIILNTQTLKIIG